MIKVRLEYLVSKEAFTFLQSVKASAGECRAED